MNSAERQLFRDTQQELIIAQTRYIQDGYFKYASQLEELIERIGSLLQAEHDEAIEVHGIDTIDDGFGNVWSKQCPTCSHKSMEVVRPGKAQCGYCG